MRPENHFITNIIEFAIIRNSAFYVSGDNYNRVRFPQSLGGSFDMFNQLHI